MLSLEIVAIAADFVASWTVGLTHVIPDCILLPVLLFKHNVNMLLSD